MVQKLRNVAIPRFLISLSFVNLLNTICHQIGKTGAGNKQEIIE